MIQIRPVSDLRNKFTDIENIVREGEPVYLTKNGYGSMVVLSLEAYSKLTDSVEYALDEADRLAEVDIQRLTHEEVFGSLRGINDLHESDSVVVKNKAFEKLESLRRKAPEIDYDRELESYREEKYGTANID